IERADLLEQPELAAVAARVRRWDEWNEIVHAWTTKHTTAEIVEQAAAFRIPCAPVADAEMLLAIEHVVEREIFGTDPAGEFLIPRRPWTIDGEPAPPRRAAPAIGAGRADATAADAPPRHDCTL